MKELERRVLDAVEKGSKTQRQLRKELDISKSYLSETLAKMEEKGLIIKEKVSERTVLISINREKIIKIGILKATEYASIFLSINDLKDFKIKLISFNNALEEMKSLVAGEIDVACSPIITGFIFHLMDDRIVVLSACARGGSGIVYEKTEGTIGSTMLSTMDIQSRIFMKEFKGIKYFLSPEEMVESFKRKEIQAISIWEPYLSFFNDKKKIYPGREDPCCGFLLFRDRINKSIKILYRKFIENSKNLRDGKRIEEAAESMSEFFKIDKNIIIQSMKSYDFCNDLDENNILKIMEKFGINVNMRLVNSYLNKN